MRMRTVFNMILSLAVIVSLALVQRENNAKQVHDTGYAKAEKGMFDGEVADFLVNSADARMMDSLEGSLAIAKGSRTEIRVYGQRMIKDQALMLKEIKALAEERGINLPGSLSLEKQRLYQKLASKNGRAFDERFIKVMTADHQRDILLLEQGIKLEDEAVSQFAKTAKPVIEEHLRTIEKIKNYCE